MILSHSEISVGKKRNEYQYTEKVLFVKISFRIILMCPYKSIYFYKNNYVYFLLVLAERAKSRHREIICGKKNTNSPLAASLYILNHKICQMVVILL